MKILNKIPEGTIRAFIVLITLYGAFVIGISFIQIMFTDRMTIDDCVWVEEFNGKRQDSAVYIVNIQEGGVADIAGLKNGDILTHINGKSFKGPFGAQDIINTYNKENITYTIIRDGQLMNVDIWVYKHFNIQYFIFSLLAISFLFVGFLVGFSKPKEFISQLFFLLGYTAMGLLLFATVFYNDIDGGMFAFYNYMISLCLFPPLLIHFVLTYPIKYEFSSRKFILWMLYLLSFFPFILGFVVDLLFNNVNVFQFDIRGVLTGLYVLVAVVIFIISYSKIKNPVQRKSLGIILSGFVIGGIGFIYYLLMNYILKQVYFLVDPLYLAPVFLVLSIPVAFGYSIFKYRILDTEFIVKKGLVFGILTTFIIAAYLLIVYLLNSLLSGFVSESRQFLTIATIVIITLTFDYVNGKAREFVDRQFYRERYNYRKSLLSFSQELPYMSNINETLRKLSDSVHESMGLKSFDITIFSRKYELLVNKNYDERFSDLKEARPRTFSDVFEFIFSKQRTPQVLSEANMIELGLSEEQKSIIRDAKIALSVPVFFKGELIAALNFGEKPSGKAYSDEDIDLLKTLASQSAIAFENARLQNEEINKQRIEKELIVARDIQNSLLPKENLTDNRIEVSWLSRPAKYIGGDFYDLIKIDDDKYLVVVADVSGKGIPAAMYMSKVQAMIQLAASVFKTPREILIEVNKQLFDSLDKNSFVTVIAAMFDFKEMKVKVARAGHNPALFSQNGVIEVMKNRGIGLGVGDQKLFEKHLEEIEINLTPDNLFVLYSDGLTEAMNPIKEEYGIERLVDALKPVRYDSSDRIVHNIIDSVHSFTKEADQHDDITLVIVKTR
jgi:serine phosphatase RsbU (regulator of sigma subunit)